MNIIEPFILKALLGGIGIAALVGPLGCFVVWRRMAYFGDSLAHSALLGIVLGIMIGVGTNIGIIVISIIFALLLFWLQRKQVLATDTLLGILAHTALSIGMVALSVSKLRINLHQFLFGDILAISTHDIAWIYIGGVVIISSLIWLWRPLLLTTIHEGIAKAEGVKVELVNFMLVLLMAIMVALSIRMVGILLITSLLIIPAASARQIAKSPEHMAVTASCLGIISVIMGIASSYYLDTPSGPSIVSVSALLFLIIALFVGASSLRRT